MGVQRVCGRPAARVVVLLVGATCGCAGTTQPTPTPPPGTPSPPAFVSPAPPTDPRVQKLEASVELLTDRVNDIYLRQVELEKRVEELEGEAERRGDAPDAAHEAK
jgi:hypothetical protein